jgi:hypothetical protein
MIRLIFALALIASPALAQDALRPGGVYVGGAARIFAINPHPSLVISCGDGSITINTKDGSVALDRCTPDEGGKAFWDAVARMFPGVAK